MSSLSVLDCRKSLIHGLIPAAPVLFTASGQIDATAQQRYAAHMARQRVAGAAVWAHTGRGLLLSSGQRIQVLRAWHDGLGPGKLLFEDHFQVQMLDGVHSAPAGDDRADFLVYANRLFDPGKEFEGKLGVAYGGPDLSDRNLAVLEKFLSVRSDADARTRQPDLVDHLPISASGGIHSGRIAAEYLLRGASSFQTAHLSGNCPTGNSPCRPGARERALHRLLRMASSPGCWT